MITLLLIILFISLLVYSIKLNYQYWERRGVPGPKPTVIVGNLGDSFFLRRTFLETIGNIYSEYKHHGIVGIYKASTPSLLICDPDAIRDVMIKSFDHFNENGIEIDKTREPLFGRNPFFLKGEEWKSVRAILSPAFSSGKMKSVYPLLESGSKELVNFIAKQGTTIEGYEAKQLCSKYTLNNVATVAFGIDAKCFEDDNSEFKQIVQNFFTPGTFQSIFFLLGSFFPILWKILPIKLVPKEVDDRITNMVSQTLQYREENKIVRHDFLNILHELKKTCKKIEFTDVDVAAHAASFIVDGYETVAVAMSFLVYLLAANGEIQEKLRKEILHHFKENKNELSYETLYSMQYLDAVINEGLRMYPPIGTFGKKCTKPHTLLSKHSDGSIKTVSVEKGTQIFISLYGLHRDSNYFENPNKFKPERFIDSNKKNINKYTFMPFGEGPRACLGQRFGLLQIKSGISHILKNFELKVNAKTQEPIQFNSSNFLMEAKGGLWINFKKIT